MKQLNDQYFTYRQTPVDYDGVARPSIKGNTLVWNQLCENGNFADTSTWSASGGSTFSVSNNVATFKASAGWGNVSKNISSSIVPSGHTLLFIVTAKSYTNTGTTVMIRDLESGTTSNPHSATLSTTTQTYALLHTRTNTTYCQIIPCQDNNASGWGNIEISNVMLIDLTLLNDSHITDYNSFRNYFSLPYYAHGQYLLNFNGTGIKTTGKNLCDNSTIVVGYYTSQVINQDRNYRTSALIPVMPNTTYIGTLFDGNGTEISRLVYTEWDGNGNYISQSTSTTITTSSQTAYLRVRNYSGQTSYVTSNNFLYQLEIGSSATSYEPYTSSTLSLPISTYFPTGMKSAGTVYDELTESKAITRAGSYTFTGNETISSSADLGTYYRVEITGSSITPNIKGLGGTVYPQATSSFAPYEVNYSGDSLHFYYYGNTWRLFIPVSSNAEALTYLTGKEINYELATYTEQDVDPIYYNFYGNGTEQLLPVNTDTPSTSPLLADIIYYKLTDSEVPYRVFWAINSKGERWDFTEREFKSFMNNPQGLGFSKTISVNRYGNVQNLTDITDNFPQPNGEVLFYDSSNSTRYDKYNQFVKFLSYEPITLYYKIPVSFYSRIPNTYSLECVVGTLTKTESKTDNMMNCSITYNALSFYKGEEVEISGTGLTYTINNDGDFPVGFEIEINATYNFYMKNPYIQLSQDGSLYGEAKFIDDTRFNKVYINSKDGEQNVILQQSGSVLPNPMSYQDLSISNGSIYVTFVKLARGETTLTIGADSQNITDVTIKYTPIYRSV